MKTDREKMKKELLDSLQNDPEAAELLRIWEMIPEDEKLLSETEMASDTHRVLEAAFSTEKQEKTKIPAKPFRLWGALAAIAATILLVFLFNRPPETVQLMGETAEGKQFTLPDGSTVLLSAGSSLQLKSNMKSNRNVVLHGEALFDVVPGKIPFQVETSNAVISVLGTIFKVTNGVFVDAAAENYTKVTLAEGKVAVHYPALNSTDELAPGEESSLVGIKKSKRTVQSGWLENWKRGRLHFENESLGFIFSEIQRVYQVDIDIAANVKLDERLSFYRHKTITPDSVLMEIAAVKNLSVSFNNNVYRITR